MKTHIFDKFQALSNTHVMSIQSSVKRNATVVTKQKCSPYACNQSFSHCTTQLYQSNIFFNAVSFYKRRSFYLKTKEFSSYRVECLNVNLGDIYTNHWTFKKSRYKFPGTILFNSNKSAHRRAAIQATLPPPPPPAPPPLVSQSRCLTYVNCLPLQQNEFNFNVLS